MDRIMAVDGAPLAPESLRMLDYLRTRASEMSAMAIRSRIHSAAGELEDAIAAVTASEARLRPFAGKWTIAEVVDHISQTQVRGAEELRHLLAGRRPPLPPVYEALRSGAGQWAPWELLVEELHQANRAMIEVLEAASDHPSDGNAPTVRTVMVALRKLENTSTEPQIFFVELTWKEYALLQRLHLLDHRRQVKELHAAAAAG
jgi:hypothetical protein